MKIKITTLVLFLFIVVSNAFAIPDRDFPTPEILQDNVKFWKRIYTQVSVSEGLLHDRKYPLIIYKKIKTGNRYGKNLSKFVKKQKAEIIDSLERILTVSPSLWSSNEKRIANLFQAYASMAEIRPAIDRIRFQQGMREQFKEGLIRSGMYMNEIFAILKRYKLPIRLAYLPHVESSFNIKATSRAGAAGLWQFMPSTGKRFLRIDKYIDERRDPILSTVAAAKLLKKNYEILKSWPLAITAYNYGLSGIKRAVESTGSNDISTIITKHKSGSFQFASKNFYSCFLAACLIDENYLYYFKDIELNPCLLRKTIKLSEKVNPTILCKTINLPLEDFKKLNPAIKSIFYKQNIEIPKNYKFFVPVSMKRTKIKSLVKALKNKKQKPDKYEQKFIFYRVNKGESLGEIAQKYGLSAQDIASANSMSKYSTIYAGDSLKIPLNDDLFEKTPIVSRSTKNFRNEEKTEKISHERPKPNIREQKFENKYVTPMDDPAIPHYSIVETRDFSGHSILGIGSNNENFQAVPYKVNKNDSLWLIAAKFDVSEESIMKANNITKNSQIYPGKTLIIPQKWTRHNPIMMAQKYDDESKDYDDEEMYPIQTYGISKNNQNSKKPYYIKIESVPEEKKNIYKSNIRVEAPPIQISPIQIKESKSIKRKKDLPVYKNKYKKEDFSLYTVKKGDSLWLISKKTGHSKEAIKKLNNLKRSRIYPGQKLKLPKNKNNKILIADSEIIEKKEKINLQQIDAVQEKIKIEIASYYTVKKGENLSTVAKKTGVPIEKVALVNHMDINETIYEGQVLRIPKQEKDEE